MIKLAIPGFGPLEIRHVVSDYTGTHSFQGAVRGSIKALLTRLAELVEVHIVTVDTFGTARRELEQLPIQLHFLEDATGLDEQKRQFVLQYDPKHVAAFGNGNTDRLFLKSVRDAGGLAVAVDNGEGCAIDTMLNANIFVHGSEQALELLLEPTRCKATLRF
jgi:soluble P-type ATPase